MPATYTTRLNIRKIQPTDYFISDTFNAILDDIDAKVLGLDHLQTALHWTEWEANTTYIANDVVRWPNMKSHQYAKCITGGTSGGIEPGNNVTGSVLTEGSVTWKVMSLTEATDNSAPIMIWLGGEIYSRGDIVIYANALYRAKVNHIASGTFEPDKSKWQEIYASIRPWVLNKFYYEDDTVIVNNVIYKCNADHTSASTFTNTGEVPYWDIVGNLARASEWHSVTNYLKDQLITKNGLLYRAVETHTSSGVFTDDTLKWEPVFASIIPWTSNAWYDQDVVVYYNNVLYKCISPHVSRSNFDYSKWELLHDPNGYVRGWVGSTHYYQNQLVRHNGNLYRCNTSNNDVSFTIAKWDLLTDSINDWIGSRDYVVGQYVNYNGILYKCITANNDTNFTISNWQKVSGGGIDLWSANTDYIVGDVVVYANKIYKCNTSHTSQSTFTPDASKWTEISACITRIPDWLVSTDYVVGDLVAHDAKIYRCTTAHTSGNMWNSTEEANWEELSPTINEISDWAVSTDYAVGQLVIHNDKLYRCNTAHTSDSTSFNTDIAYWDAISDSGGIETWASNEPYSQGNMVVYNDKIYVCDTAHTSTSTFDPTKWHEVSTGDIKLWASSTDYSVGNDVIYQNKLYRCTTAHTSTSTFDQSKWTEISPMKFSDWSASTDYIVGDYVLHNNKIYKCTTSHISSSTFDPTKWVEISPSGILLWSTSTPYDVGDIVIYNNKLYRCNTAHNSDSTSFNTDIANWDVIGSSGGINPWRANEIYLQGDIVVKDDKIYRCTTAHTSTSTFDKSKWTEVSASDIPLWEVNTRYIVGRLVINDGQIYRCITAHISDSTSFNTDIAKWQVLDTKWLAPQWSSNKLYLQNEIITYDDVLYKVNATHISSSNFSTDVANFNFVYSNIRDWVNSTYYPQGSIIIHGGELYKCKSTHTSTNDDFGEYYIYDNNSQVGGTGLLSVSASDTLPKSAVKDLGDVYLVSKVLYRISTGIAGGTIKFKVSISMDDITYTDVYSAEVYNNADTWGNTYTIELEPIKTRYIKLTILFTDDGYWHTPMDVTTSRDCAYGISDLWEHLCDYEVLKQWISSTSYDVGDIVVNKNSSGIFNWFSGNTYAVDDLVTYGNCIYRCINAGSSVTFDPSDWEFVSRVRLSIYRCVTANSDISFTSNKWEEISPCFDSSIFDWKSSTYYTINDIVVYNGNIYRCNAVHTSSSTFATDSANWDAIGGGEGISSWTSSTEYSVGDIVVYNNRLYRCTNGHTSLSNFRADASDWALLSNIQAWSSGKEYVSGNVVYTNSRVYICITPHTSSSTFNTDINNWQMLTSPNILNNWASNTDYLNKELVSYDGVVYRSNSDHTSSSAISSDDSKLDFVYANLREWASNTYYRQGSIVKREGGIYECLTSHTSGSSFISNYAYDGSGHILYNRDWDAAYDTTVQEYTFDLLGAKNITNIHFDLYSKSARWLTLTFTISTDNTTFTPLYTWNSVTSGWSENETWDIPITGYGRYVKVSASNMQEWSRPKRFEVTTLKIKAVDSDNWKLLSGYPIWKSSVEYAVGNLVTYNNDIYRCTANNSYSTFDPTNWEKITGYGGGICSWSAGTAYLVNDMVTYQNRIYKCTTAHTSSTFSSDIANWVEVSPTTISDWQSQANYSVDSVVLYDNSTGISNWVSGTSYNVGDKVVYNNKIYECTTANSDATFDASNWDIPVDVTTILYRCVTANNDTNFTPSKWEVVGHLYATDADIDNLFI